MRRVVEAAGVAAAGVMGLVFTPLIFLSYKYVQYECRRSYLVAALSRFPDYQLFQRVDTKELTLFRKIGDIWIDIRTGRRPVDEKLYVKLDV